MTEIIPLILKWLSTHYRIEATNIAQLPLGADINASIYKVQASDQKIYFVKLREGEANKTHIAILDLLQTAGIAELIAPIKTREGAQIQQVDGFTLLVYPFVEGQDGFCCSLNDDHWRALGRAMKQVHAAEVPPSLQAHMRREEFSSKWRDIVRSIYLHPEAVTSNDEIARNLWAFLQENKPMIQRLVDRAEHLGQIARRHAPEYVLCHSDIHGGNVLIDNTGHLYIVDWDDPILAPKERDLMFIGGGVGNVWNKPHEEALFYQGYGPVQIDWTLLAYYRYERIVEDIAIYCQELLSKRGGDRLLMYEQFMSQFEPNGVVDIAFKTKEHA